MIREASQALVLRALETGWEGPPFNPLYIARMLDVQVEANSSIAEQLVLLKWRVVQKLSLIRSRLESGFAFRSRTKWPICFSQIGTTKYAIVANRSLSTTNGS